MHPRWALLGFLAVVAVAATVGSLAALDASQQYGSLEQPAWAPPAWLFGPVWTVLYGTIAVAGWLLWRVVGLRDWTLGLWGAQLAVNALWTPLFFAAGLRGLALAWILGLDALVVLLIAWAWPQNRLAAWLLTPYLAWILFATALNAAVWWLNR